MKLDNKMIEDVIRRVLNDYGEEKSWEYGYGIFETMDDAIEASAVAQKAKKSPGVEDLTTQAIAGDDGLTLIEYCPFGVIGAISPTTNPTKTIICNSIGMLAGGNTVVFSPHPRSKGVSIWLIKKLNALFKK